jgi:hypothetical protein
MRATVTLFGCALVLALALSAEAGPAAPGPCNPNPCANKGVCVDTVASKLQSPSKYLCLCRSGTFGPKCSLVGSKGNSKSCNNNNPCGKNGVCVSTTNRDIGCVCKIGWQGKDCKQAQQTATATNPQPGAGGCRSNPCRNGGVCKGWDEWAYTCVGAQVPTQTSDPHAPVWSIGAGGCRSSPCPSASTFPTAHLHTVTQCATRAGWSAHLPTSIALSVWVLSSGACRGVLGTWRLGL